MLELPDIPDLTAAPGVSTEVPPKRRLVLEAATELFLAYGYGAVSMDAVARRAGVSKATLYAHFDSKDSLFGALIGACAASNILEDALFPPQAAALRPVLQTIGGRVVRFFLAPRTLAVHRMTVAESVRFPELGRTFYESGPRRFRERIAAWVALQQRAGLLRAAEPEVAAGQFISLLRTDLLLRAVLAVPPPPTEAEIEAVVAGAVDTWLLAFAADRHAATGG